MLPQHARGMDRRTVDVDSTAVLTFEDGARIPCDRYVLRCYSAVVRRLLEDAACAVDHRNRTMVPMPAQASAAYWKAVDVLHGHVDPGAMDLDAVVATTRCMDFLDVGAFREALDARLWDLASKGDDVGALVRHAPRLLGNAGLAARVCKRLIVLRPAWAEFRRDVLAPLEPHADHAVVRALVTYAPNFFPPALVVAWALSALRDPTPEALLWAASQHGVMYHPSEAVPVLREVRAAFRRHKWSAGVSGLADMALASGETFDPAPWTEDLVHGTVLRYSDAKQLSACVLCPGGRLPRRTKVAEWMTLSVQRDGRLDVRFDPTHDDFSGVLGSLQLRVMCFDRACISEARCAESWHCYSNMSLLLDEGEDYSLADATRVVGDHEAVVGMVAARTVRAVRFDFFFRPTPVLEDPFDETKCEAYVSRPTGAAW